jgi:hypothetical protein
MIKDYFKILEPVLPKWLEEYIEVPTMLRSALRQPTQLEAQTGKLQIRHSKLSSGW